jgi:RimJ/RimL family protein N-acetyltransferase
MAFVNNYVPPQHKDVDITLKEEYDTNSAIAIPVVLETSRVQLVPFHPILHAKAFYIAYEKDAAAIDKYLPMEWPTFESFLILIEAFVRSDTASALFTIIATTEVPDAELSPQVMNGRVAGLIGWLHASPAHLTVEIGPVIVLPEFQRTHVTSNAIGLLLCYFLDTSMDGGLGFRRVVWCASPLNTTSITTAKKMCFVQEGVMRWTWVIPEGKEGNLKPVDGRRGIRNGRDSVLLALCWDDWVNGANEQVAKRMERV